jgi:hypothetical protein
LSILSEHSKQICITNGVIEFRVSAENIYLNILRKDLERLFKPFLNTKEAQTFRPESGPYTNNPSTPNDDYCRRAVQCTENVIPKMF